MLSLRLLPLVGCLLLIASNVGRLTLYVKELFTTFPTCFPMVLLCLLIVWITLLLPHGIRFSVGVVSEPQMSCVYMVQYVVPY
jgi:hypothetical protein